MYCEHYKCHSILLHVVSPLEARDEAFLHVPGQILFVMTKNRLFECWETLYLHVLYFIIMTQDRRLSEQWCYSAHGHTLTQVWYNKNT